MAFRPLAIRYVVPRGGPPQGDRKRASFRSRKRRSTRSTRYPTFTRVAQFSHSEMKQIAFGNTDPLITHAAVTDFRPPRHDASAAYSNRVGAGKVDSRSRRLRGRNFTPKRLQVRFLDEVAFLQHGDKKNCSQPSINTARYPTNFKYCSQSTAHYAVKTVLLFFFFFSENE